MSVRSEPIYLDNNAGTAVARECVVAMLECLREGPGNPSSKHQLGERAKQRLTEARAQVAALIGATPPEIVFTGGGTEANHAAILGALALDPARRHVVTSAVEHPSTLMLLRRLESEGARMTYLPVDSEGRLDEQELVRAITPDTALVSLMWANNETGVLFPIESAAALCRARGVLFHTDAVQAAGKIPIDLKNVPVDLLSLSGHKLHAPPGVGALYVRKGVKLPPLLLGHQERHRRGGTENLPGIAALGAACALAADGLRAEAEWVRGLRDHLETGVLARVPGTRINGAAALRLPNTSNIRFGVLDAEVILTRLDRLGVCAAAGAACAAGSTEPSHVLTAMGLDRRAALASIRFSLSRYTTREEIDWLLAVLPGVVNFAGAAAA
jgi:cysteine desulfurase